jgi:hypothetical protein
MPGFLLARLSISDSMTGFWYTICGNWSISSIATGRRAGVIKVIYSNFKYCQLGVSFVTPAGYTLRFASFW